MLSSKYTVKNFGSLGFGPEDVSELCVLNRTLRAGEDEHCRHIDWVPDVRHVSVLLKSVGLAAKGKHVPKATSTAREKLKDEVVVAQSKGPKSNPEEATKFRSDPMRIQYLSQDRCDIAEASKC